VSGLSTALHMRPLGDPASVLEALARTGFLVKGALYITIGWLALQVVTGRGGKVTGSEGALITILQQPFGRTLLLIAVFGLFGYAIWRVLQGILDPDREGRGLKGLALRSSFVFRGVLQGLLGWQALRLYRGLKLSRGDETSLLRELFAWPLGEWVLVLIGVGVLAYAVYELYTAVTGRLPRDLDVRRLLRDAGPWVIAVSRLGIAARAVVLGMLALLMIRGGVTQDASQVAGTTKSVRTLAAQPEPFGTWLMVFVAAGFVAYGPLSSRPRALSSHSTGSLKRDGSRCRRMLTGRSQSACRRLLPRY
jgi:hypothetical protein